MGKSSENERGRVQRTEVQRKKFRRPEVRVFFSGFLGRMVRGERGHKVKPVLCSGEKRTPAKRDTDIACVLLF